MSTSRKVILTLCILAVILIGLCTVVPILRLHLITNIYIFSDISECDSLETLNVENGYFTRYQNAMLDNNLSGLQYTEFFAGTYSCDQYTFEIFAYEFIDSVAAKTYFENATGKNSAASDANFSMVSGIATCHIIVFEGDRAYAIYCPSNDLSDVSVVLADHFQIKIK